MLEDALQAALHDSDWKSQSADQAGDSIPSSGFPRNGRNSGPQHLLESQIYQQISVVSLKYWYPQIIHFNGIFPYKPTILGYPIVPPFMEPPKWILYQGWWRMVAHGGPELPEARPISPCGAWRSKRKLLGCTPCSLAIRKLMCQSLSCHESWTIST